MMLQKKNSNNEDSIKSISTSTKQQTPTVKSSSAEGKIKKLSRSKNKNKFSNISATNENVKAFDKEKSKRGQRKI